MGDEGRRARQSIAIDHNGSSIAALVRVLLDLAAQREHVSTSMTRGPPAWARTSHARCVVPDDGLCFRVGVCVEG